MMGKTKIDFYTAFFFPMGVVFVGAVLILVGPLVMFSQLALGIMVFFGGILAATTHVRVSIDLQNKNYREYIVFFGLRIGKHEQFHQLDYLFVRKTRISQRVGGRVSSSTFYSERYEGYLHYDGDVMLHLFSSGKKIKVLKRLKDLSGELDLTVIDKTAERQ